MNTVIACRKTAGIRLVSNLAIRDVAELCSFF